jgi:hypothetical protein
VAGSQEGRHDACLRVEGASYLCKGRERVRSDRRGRAHEFRSPISLRWVGDGPVIDRSRPATPRISGTSEITSRLGRSSIGAGRSQNGIPRRASPKTNIIERPRRVAGFRPLMDRKQERGVLKRARERSGIQG